MLWCWVRLAVDKVQARVQDGGLVCDISTTCFRYQCAHRGSYSDLSLSFFFPSSPPFLISHLSSLVSHLSSLVAHLRVRHFFDIKTIVGLDLLKVLRVLPVADEIHRRTLPPKPRSPPDTMGVRLQVTLRVPPAPLPRHVVVDDEEDAGDVQPTRRDIRAYQNLGEPLFELPQHRVALQRHLPLVALAAAPYLRREHGGDVAVPHHEFGQVPAPVPGVAKYDRLGLKGKREGGGAEDEEEKRRSMWCVC